MRSGICRHSDATVTRKKSWGLGNIGRFKVPDLIPDLTVALTLYNQLPGCGTGEDTPTSTGNQLQLALEHTNPLRAGVSLGGDYWRDWEGKPQDKKKQCARGLLNGKRGAGRERGTGENSTMRYSKGEESGEKAFRCGGEMSGQG
ncbi:hypothetical protein BDZ91DRAFT_767367 [Kalaharituber pfeilii]|nr:hypothetical protein BDZ91DRAFT_767367 [Kalaharituber pfeilii]